MIPLAIWWGYRFGVGSSPGVKWFYPYGRAPSRCFPFVALDGTELVTFTALTFPA
jgi:hypothetical protein